MTRVSKRRCVLFLSAVAIALWGLRGDAMYPSVVMFHGDGLREPVFITDGNGIAELLDDHYRGRRSPALESRAYLKVSLFWGSEWSGLTRSELRKLQPAAANQHGRFYQASGDRPAALALTPAPRYAGTKSPFPEDDAAFGGLQEVSAEGLAFLRRQGVPVAAPR